MGSLLLESNSIFYRQDVRAASLIMWILAIIGMWKIFTKMGEEGWKSIIPVYNLVVLFKKIGLNPWLLLLFLVPIANVILVIVYCNKLAKAFGKGLGYTLGIIFFGPIFIFILGINSSLYLGENN